MNGHPRRDTDVILRLSKATIEDLSFDIGFVKEFRVKMKVFDEIMAFVRLRIGPRIKDQGSRIKDQDHGSRIRTKDQG